MSFRSLKSPFSWRNRSGSASDAAAAAGGAGGGAVETADAAADGVIDNNKGCQVMEFGRQKALSIKTMKHKPKKTKGSIWRTLRSKLGSGNHHRCCSRAGSESHSEDSDHGCKSGKPKAVCGIRSPLQLTRRDSIDGGERDDGEEEEEVVAAAAAAAVEMGGEMQAVWRRVGTIEERKSPVNLIQSDRLEFTMSYLEPPAAAAATALGSLTMELFRLSRYGWYWGPITRMEAEEKLLDQSDGAFLVRDSSDDRYLLSLSFRSYGKTLHTRIEHCNGLFSFYAQSEPEGHTSIVDLIERSMSYSQSGVFCYSRARMPGSPSFPVRLTKPISRFTQVRSLQYLCRFIIRQYTRFDHIQKLPLPNRIKGYIEEGHY